MATMTVAQALASSATGITIADTPANIAAVVFNTGLLARVTEFTLSGNGASNASDARLLATLGSRFSPGSYRYVVRDTVAALSDQRNAAGLAIASAFSVFDTATNLLAASGSSLMQRASSVVLSTGASLTLANLLRLEALPSFSVMPGKSITLADTASNLLALTPAQNRPAIKAFQVVGTSNVELAAALTLKALPNFSIASGSNLVVTGTAADMTSVGNATAVSSLAAVNGVVISVSDTVAHILPAVSALTGLVARAASSSIVVNESATIDAAGAAGLLPLFGRLFVAAGRTLTLADTAEHLLATARNAASLVQATALASDADVTAAQLAALAGMRNFAVQGGVNLAVTDTLAALTALTGQQRALASAVVVQDTAQHLLQASGLPSGTTALIVQLEGGVYTAAQAAQIGGLAREGLGFTLQPTGGGTEIVVSDTIQAIATESGRLAALIGHGPVAFSPTDHDVTLSATSAVAVIALDALDLAAARISVSDTGEAITAARASLFAADLVSIVVTDGVFSGNLDELLDPRLHLGAGSGIVTMGFAMMALASTPSAHLATDATVSAAQMIALSLLSGFAVDPGVTLTVADTAESLVSAAAAIGSFATEIVVQDDANLTADQATTLAELQGAVGPLHFSMDGHTLTVADSAGHLTALANAAGVELATTVALDSDSVVTAAQAQVLVDLGARFTTGEHGLVVIDTASALSVLAANTDAVTAINGWGAPVLLSADAVLDIAAGQVLLRFAGFGSGAHRLTIADTAANLLADTEAAPLALASAVRLSADATVTAAAAATLAELRSFGTGGHALTIADTPAQLLGMTSSVAALATSESLVPRTVGNAADYTITAAQLGQLLAMPHLSASGFTGLITVADTADALAALAPTFANVTLGSLLSRVVVSLTGDAVLGATSASALAQLPGFALGGHSLAVHDTPTALLSPEATTGIGMATSVGISGPATVGVAVLTALADLHAFASDGYPLVCADTPLALLGLASPAAALADRLEVAAPAGDLSPYTLTTAQFTTLATTAKLSLTGFGGTLVVRDTPSALVALATSFAAASSGAPLLAARAAMAAQLSQDGTVSVSDLLALADLPQFQLNGHSLVLQDTPAALLAAGLSTLPLVSSITLASDAQPWIVDAAEAAFLAALPNFTPGSTGFVVVDTAPAILLPGNAAGLALATGITLSADATITALDAATLYGLGTFTVGTHHLTIQDGAGRVAALAAGAAALATDIVLQGDAVVSAAQFAALRALPNLSTGGHAVVLMDDAASLLTLAGGNLGLATTIVLASNASLTADEADTLATMPNFTAGTAQIAILDTAAHLLQVTGSGSQPDDWAGELLATTVTLSQDATVDAAGAAELALLGSRFSRGGHALVVSDTAANLTAAANADGVALATALVLSGDEPGVSAETATRLAALSGFGKGGHTITVSDTAAALAFAGYAAGLALADHVQLAAPATLTVADAAALIGMAGFQPNVGAALQIADTLPHLLTLGTLSLPQHDADLRATAIGLSEDGSGSAADLASLAALPQAATFSRNGHALVLRDSGAHIAAYAPSGSVIPTGYVMVGEATVSAAQATLLATRAVDLDGNALTVADTVSALLDAGSIAGEAIASAVRLSGNATASVAQADLLFAMPTFSTGGYVLTINGTATGLLGLSTAAKQFATTLALAASETVDVATLAGLVQFGFKFDRAGHTLTVQDDAANLATLNSFETALAGSEILGTSAIVDADTAERLAALPVFTLGSGVTLTVQDTAQALIALSAAVRAVASVERLPPGSAIITAAEVAGLRALPNFVSTGTAITVQPDSVANVLAFASDVAAIGATIAVFDTAANVLAALDGLQALPPNLVGSITLSDGGTPVMTMTIATLAADGTVLSAIVSPFSITITDTAAHIATDLAAGSGAALLVHRTAIGSVVVSGGGIVGLTDTEALTAGVADGPASIMAKLSGSTFVVTGAAIARLDALAALATAPAAIAVLDTAAGIEADLTSGSSRLVAHRAALSGIAVNGGGTITLTDAQVQAAHVNDGSGSVFSLLSGASLIVVGVSVAHADAIAALPVAAQSFTISDTAAAIQADLASGLASHLLAHLATISGIGVSDAGMVSLTVAETLATGVDDGAGSALAKLTGGTFRVTDAPVGLLGVLANLVRVPDVITVSDLASEIEADLIAVPSQLLAQLSRISSIVVADSGVITLTVAQTLAAGVDDGPDSVMAKVQGGSFVVTDAHVTDLALLAALPVPPTSIQVSATAAAIVADLTSGQSELLAHAARLSILDVSDGGTIALSVAQVTLASVDDGPSSVLARTIHGGLLITGAAIADFVTIEGLWRQPTGVTVLDTAANLQSDLAGGNSVLLAHAAEITSIASIEPSITFTLSVAQLAPSLAVLGNVASLFEVRVVDSAANIAADLADPSSIVAQLTTVITGITLTDGGTPTITLSIARFDASRQALNFIDSPYHLDIADSDTALQADLVSAGSILRASVAAVHAITVTGGTVITLTMTQAVQAGVAAVLALTTGITTVMVAEVAVADVPTVAALGIAHLAMMIHDTAAAVEADLTGAGSALEAQAGAIAGIVLTDVGTPTLLFDVARLTATSGLVSRISTPYTIAIVDTAAHVQSDLAGATPELVTHAAALSSITLTDGGTPTIALSMTQVSTAGTVLARIGSSFHLAIADTAANVQADLASTTPTLLTLLSSITAITLTDGGTPSIVLTLAQVAADSAALALIASPWQLQVLDTAAAVEADLAGGPASVLLDYGATLTGVTLTVGTTITLTEAQATYAGVAAVLATTSGLGSFVVTDVAVAQVPTVLGLGIDNTRMSIVDTAAQVQADLTGAGHLLANIADIADITLSDGAVPTITLSIARVVADHAVLIRVGLPWSLAVADTAANLQADLAAGSGSALTAYGAMLTGITLTSGSTITLTEAQVTQPGIVNVLAVTSGLTTLTITGVSVAQIPTMLGLGIPNTVLAISDTAAHIEADLIGAGTLLFHDAAISAIDLTDGGSPTITLTLAQLRIDSTVLNKIALPWSLAITDSAANLQADLALGGGSALAAFAAMLTDVTLSAGDTITLTEAQATSGSVASVLSLTTGLNDFIVTNVSLAQISTVLGLGVAHTRLAIADTAAHIEADLTGGTPQLTNGTVVAALAGITLTDATPPTITLSLAQATAAVTALQVIGSTWHLAISDTAANVQADLAAGVGSTLLAHSSELIGVTLSGGSTITLTEAQATRAGVGTVLALTAGLTSLVVTGATIAQVTDVLALGIATTSKTVTDTAAHLQADLNLGGASILLTHISSISTIALSDGGTPILSLNVAGLTSATPVLAAISSSYALALSDTAAHVQADLAASGGSAILAQGGSLASISLSVGDTITLTEAQATYSGVADALIATSGLATFVVTEVTIGQISTVTGLGVSGTRISVSDTAANVQADLTSGGVLLAHVATLVGISLTDGGTPTLTLTVAEFGSNASVLALIGGSVNVTVSDTAAHVQSDLTGGSSVLTAHASLITTVALTDGGTPALTLTVAQVAASTAVLTRISSSYQITISDTAANVEADLVAASPGLVAVDGVLGTITLTDGTTPTITLSVAQISAGATVLGQIGSTYDLVAADTSVHVQLDLAQGAGSALLGRGAALTGITLTTGSTIALTEAQAVHAGVATALGLVSGMSIFLVMNVAVAQIGTVVSLGVGGTRLAIEDTAANVLADLTGAGDLLAHLGVIFGITLTDFGTPAITLTLAQVSANDLVLNAITSPWTLEVTDAAANVQADLEAGSGSVLIAHASVLGSITLTGGTTITLTEAEAVYAGVAAALIATTNLSSFVVTGVSVAQLPAVVALAVPHTSAAISDTAAHVEADLVGAGTLLADIARIGGITLTDGGTPTLAFNIAQLSAGTPVLAQIGSSYQLVITDTATNVQADLALGAGSALVTHRSVLDQLNVSSGDITLTSAEVQVTGVDDGPSSVLAKMAGAQLYVTDVAVADITAVIGLPVAPQSITVLDTAAHIAADIAGAAVIAAHTPGITSVRTTETTLDAGTAATLYNGLHAVTTFDESALTVTDTATGLLAAASAAPAMLAAAAHVTMSGNPTGLTAAQATTLAAILGGALQLGQTMGIADTVSNLLLPGNAAGIALATSVTLDAPATTTAALATQLVGLHAYTSGPALTIADTVANLLDGANLAGINAATTVSPSTDVTVDAATLHDLAGLHGYGAGTHVLTVQDTVTAVLALTPTELGFAGIVSVQDTMAHVTASVGTLQAAFPDQGHVLSITLTDASSNVIAIDLTATGYAAAADTYAAITNTGVMRVTGNAAELAAIATALKFNAAVGEVDVVDTAENILSNLTALTGIGSKFMNATISDTVVNAAEVAALLTVPNLIATGLTIEDTGTQVAAAIMANGTPGLTFMNDHAVRLTADSVITAAEAVLLEQLTSFSKNGYSLYIWDTAPHLTDSASGYLAAAQNALIDGVYLKATGHIATVSATLASSLLSILAFNRNDPPIPVGDGLPNTLLVQDTASRIETYWATLSANSSALSGVVVNATATVNDTVFGHLLSLGATMDTGKTLTVRDTAANIIANATAQLSGSPSITPTAWQISGSASVSTAGAILLGSLAGFAIGAYTLTLTDSATLTVSQANTLGTFGSSLQRDGHTLDVYGDVATMTAGPGLSANAKLIVTPHITDTFANLATLTLGSGLLGGTITVSDSEAVTVAQASAFLSLLGGSGIPVGNVAFGGNVESITDTLAAIQTLTGSSAWTSTSSVHGNFHLVAADTVANLIDGSNTSALAAMNGTTLAGSETITAAAAESLFALANSIHFSKGASSLTIEDTAAHLLNPAYWDGLALADVLQLAGNATVAAADAEALLSNSRFNLNHTLTVADTAASLLDGVLASAISSSPYAASVVVELAAPETMDAGTARALVNLPGYHDTGTLTIADDASYLLNSANHAAEVLATSVTLIGDETVSVGTASRLVALPHFTIGSSTLHLASNDFADAAALVTIGDLDAHWDSAGFSIRMTQDALTLTPGQYAALQDDNIILNGHALSALATGVSVSSFGGTVQITGQGVANATLNVYASDGTMLSQTSGVAASFTATAAEASIGNGVVVTETVGASAATSESAPIIALERTVLTNAATSAGATFAGSGAVQVDVGKYVDIYTSSTAPAHPSSPVLVYDTSSYTLSLSIEGQTALTLVTLGTATHPTSLSASEIYIQHFV